MCRTLMLIGFRGRFRKLSTNRWMQSSARSLLKRFWGYYLKIFWCTRLARAEGEDERKRIEEEMLHVGLASIVDQLHATRASAKERQQNLERGIREEARKLKSSGGDGDMARRGLVGRDGDNGWWNNQSQLLDLESLAPRHLVPNKCTLPDGSYRSHSRKGVEEVHVPAMKPKPFGANEKLVKICDMPEWARPAFKGMTQLNRIQSKLYEAAYQKGDNILLCALLLGQGKLM